MTTQIVWGAQTIQMQPFRAKHLSAIFTRLIAVILVISLSGCLFLPRPNKEVNRAAEIEAFYQKWQGTSYQYGGSNGSGIDCSALVVEAYDDLFGMPMPRTTEAQSDMGKRIRAKNLKSGDLVFFKTGIFKRHVGIYLDHGVFVHASGSGGVMKSTLRSDYWSDHYWKSKRVLN